MELNLTKKSASPLSLLAYNGVCIILGLSFLLLGAVFRMYEEYSQHA